VRFIGLGITHPLGYGTQEGNSAYYLLRHLDATYEWGRVFDPAEPLPNNDADEHGLRATRAVRLSPFPEDGGRVLYFSGFDAAALVDWTYHNTAWIHRAVLPDETPKLQLNGASFDVSTDTATSWQYQLQYTGDFTEWFNLGTALNGDNTLQTLPVTPAPGTTRQFYHWQIKRP
jgi:hypothetical protein